MDFLICAYGEPSEEQFIPYIKEYVDGVELQNYDRKGVVSEQGWSLVLSEHQGLRSKLPGRLALHGPYEGIVYGYKDHLLNEAVRRRMDMLFNAVSTLRPDTLVLHTGYSEIMVRFSLAESWLEQASAFWQQEIRRYAAAGTMVVLENVVEEAPDLMIELADRVGSEYFGLCFDIGHASLCSKLPPAAWVQHMGKHLKHIHLHDNNGVRDDHLPIGKGKINFDAFFESLNAWAPDATVSIEVIADPRVVIETAVQVTGRYRRKTGIKPS